MSRLASPPFTMSLSLHFASSMASHCSLRWVDIYILIVASFYMHLQMYSTQINSANSQFCLPVTFSISPLLWICDILSFHERISCELLCLKSEWKVWFLFMSCMNSTWVLIHTPISFEKYSFPLPVIFSYTFSNFDVVGQISCMSPFFCYISTFFRYVEFAWNNQPWLSRQCFKGWP
jgi:hypothetical protein